MALCSSTSESTLTSCTARSARKKETNPSSPTVSLDLKHFPRQKLIASKAYGMIAVFAYNFMRYAAYVLNPKQPHFAQIIRFRMVNLACKGVQHARSVTFRFSEPVTVEVNHWMAHMNRALIC